MNTMDGKICIVTGATSGIGKATALSLARMGSIVVIVGRNEEKGKRVQREIQDLSRNKNVDLFFADLSSQKSVKNLAQAFKEKYQQLHVLINNAGIFFTKRHVTEDGLEMTFAVNYLSRFLLTNLLLDLLKMSVPARIINVAGAYHAKGEIHFDDIILEHDYSSTKANNQAKLADVLFTYELARRLEGTNVTVNCLHPGAVKTGSIYKDKDTPMMMKIMYKLFSPFFSSPEKGAETSVFLASSPEVEGVTGKYFVNKKPKRSAEKTYDTDLQKKLWDISVKLTNL
ncbi:MAG: SDR family oxidoreductase [Candidatus Hodarchaeales archaeon]|jgi:NAD(P)-dependent dehydrogenase (short-subunit alcohol dehydrogenase family)